MSPLIVSLLVLSAAPQPLTLAAPGLTFVNVDEKLGAFLSEHLAQQLKLAGAEVVTQREISSMLGMERQRQLLGCSEGNACVAEIASALGTDGVLLGDLARLGERYVFNLKIIGSAGGKTLSAVSDEAPSQDALLERLTRASSTLATQAAGALGRKITPKFIVDTSGSVRKAALLPAITGGVLLLAGAVMLAVSNAQYQELVSGRVKTAAEGRSLVGSGAALQTVGAISLIGGAVAAALGAGLFLAGVAVTPTATVTNSGAAVTFTGVFP